MRLNIKKFTIKLSAGLLLLSFIVGTVGALNGWFGGGGKIPEDTFTRGLVAYWSFDEGSGNIVYDASGNNNHGSLINGPKWTQGKIGGALQFDGVNDYVEVPDSESLDITKAITVGAWVYPRARQSVYDRDGIVIKGGAYYLTITPSGKVAVHFYGLTSPGYHDSNQIVPLNQWSHIATTYDSATGKIRIYINGSLDREITTSGAINPSTYVMGIGSEWNGRSRFFNGLIDEVRIYNRALSPEEIRFHYSRGGPVGYWKFDEGSGNIAYDSSGNGNHGTLVNGPTWTSGKFGSALSFDGVDDYVEIPTTAGGSLDPDVLSVMAWIYVSGETTSVQRIFQRTSCTYGLFTSSDGLTIYFYVDTGNAGGAWKSVSYTVPSIRKWYHVVGTYDGTSMKLFINGELKAQTSQSYAVNNGGATAYIGSADPTQQFFNGTIDEVRIYNYALTPDEIRLLYNAGYAARFGPQTDCNKDPGSCMDYGLVGYWSFDEGAGNIAYDASGNGNHGTLINGPKWTQGKIGGALQFDGVNDYVRLPTSTLGNWNQLTYEVWVKAPPYTGSSWPGFIGSYTTNSSLNINLGIWQNTGHLHLEIDTDVGNYSMKGQLSIPWNTWFHAVLVYDGSTLTEYLNGQKGKSIPASGTLKRRCGSSI